MKGKKIAFSIGIGIILTIILVTLGNVGLSLFYEAPQYDDYCPNINTQATCEANGGNWTEDMRTDINYGSPKPIMNGYCQYDYTSCQTEYDKAYESYNQMKFYIFISLGIIFVLLGLFVPIGFINWAGFLTGGVLIGESIVFNWKNKWAVFITLLVSLILLGLISWKAIKKLK